MTKSLNKLEHQDFGIERENRVVIHVRPMTAGYKPPQLQGLYDKLEADLGALPGVKRVGLSLYSPLEGNSWGEDVWVQGHPEPGLHENKNSSWLRASPEFLPLVGQRLLRGRGITAQDTSTSPLVAVVNEAFVKRFFPKGDDPIGAHFGLSEMASAGEIEIVGHRLGCEVQQRTRASEADVLPAIVAAGAEVGWASVGSLYIGSIMLQVDRPWRGLSPRSGAPG